MFERGIKFFSWAFPPCSIFVVHRSVEKCEGGMRPALVDSESNLERIMQFLRLKLLAWTDPQLQNGAKAVELCLKSFTRIDSIIVNHGTLTPVKRIADCTAEEWRATYDTNLFSAVSFVSSHCTYQSAKLTMQLRSKPLSLPFGKRKDE
jgi:NAD(P)-dependent dehydrogenase (short-subunit alcohol dehydrogenase family)